MCSRAGSRTTSTICWASSSATRAWRCGRSPPDSPLSWDPRAGRRRPHVGAASWRSKCSPTPARACSSSSRWRSPSSWSGIAELIQGTISKKAVLTSSFAPDTPTIEGDVTQLRQVVLNLITNASEAIGDEPGTIEVTTGVDRGRSLVARGVPAVRRLVGRALRLLRGRRQRARDGRDDAGEDLRAVLLDEVHRPGARARRRAGDPSRPRRRDQDFERAGPRDIFQGPVSRRLRRAGDDGAESRRRARLAGKRDSRRCRRRRRSAAHGQCDARRARLHRHPGLRTAPRRSRS